MIQSTRVWASGGIIPRIIEKRAQKREQVPVNQQRELSFHTHDPESVRHEYRPSREVDVVQRSTCFPSATHFSLSFSSTKSVVNYHRIFFYFFYFFYLQKLYPIITNSFRLFTLPTTVAFRTRWFVNHTHFGARVCPVHLTVASQRKAVEIRKMLFRYDSITVSSAWELTSVSMRYSQGYGVNTSLSRLMYCTHEWSYILCSVVFLP